jgi:HEAT repeat protein
MMDKSAARIKRGQTSCLDDGLFCKLSDTELLNLLHDADAQKRTSAARMLGERKSTDAISCLCERLKHETALYTRIAISEALGAIGGPALAELVELLGQIGSNQHDELPQKGFYKKSYPLPRDIAARTIIKMGSLALKPLEKVVLEANRARALEAVDGIGHIAFYEKDTRSEAVLLATYEKARGDRVLQWKIVRAFQAFPSERVQGVLATVIGSHVCPELRWEAVRSLGQLGRAVPAEVLKCAQQDPCDEVRKMAQLFLK